jgi:hypothetical protein
MRPGAELHVLTTKRRDLAVAQTCLNGDQQKGLVPSSDPGARIGSSHKGRVPPRAVLTEPFSVNARPIPPTAPDRRRITK